MTKKPSLQLHLPIPVVARPVTLIERKGSNEVLHCFDDFIEAAAFIVKHDRQVGTQQIVRETLLRGLWVFGRRREWRATTNTRRDGR